MPELRSRTVTHGRNMAGARALMRATGVERTDFGKPIVAVANSFTQFVPGHVHLREVSEVVAGAVRAAGGVPREFNTIAGGTSGLSIGHASPEAGAGGDIALVEDGDQISIDIPNRAIQLQVPEDELATRRERRCPRRQPGGVVPPKPTFMRSIHHHSSPPPTHPRRPGRVLHAQQ